MSQEELSGTPLFSQTGIWSGRQIGVGEVSVQRVEREMGPEDSNGSALQSGKGRGG